MGNRRTLVVAAAAALACLALPVQAAVAGAGSTTGLTRLSNSAAPEAGKTASVGAVSSSSAINFQVLLNPSDLAGAKAFAQVVSTPGSAAYRQYLSAAQWEQRYSPTSGQVAEVTAFLRSNGFTVTGVSADRMAVMASGTAAQVEHSFATSLSYHQVQGFKLRLADKDLSVPTALGHVVAGVIGVSQTAAHPDDVTDGPKPAVAPSSPQVGSPQPPPAGFRAARPCGTYYGQLTASTPPFGNGYPSPAPFAICGYVPGQLRTAYNEPSGLDGSGVTVAIIDAYASPTILSDAQTYAQRNDPSHPLLNSQFNQVLPSSFTQGDTCGASGWYGEETLDVEAVHAMAPAAHIVYAGASSCFDALFTTLRNVVDGHLASIVTDSWGDTGGDVLDDAGTRAAVDNTLLMAAGTGISVLFASGDGGDNYTALGASVPDYPPSSPYDTAVGGTTLEIGAHGQRVAEYGWSTARSFLCNDTYIKLGGCTDADLGKWLPIDLALDGGSGGGTSYVYRQPSYQAGVVPASISERNAEVIGSKDPARVVPDISMEADPGTGFLVGETQVFPTGTFYDEYRIGGTSVASPLFAGLIALADQSAGGSLGFLNPALYSMYGNSSALRDVLPAGKQDEARVDYANSIGSGDGLLFSTRLIGYQGQEQFCATDNPASCTTQDVSIPALPGYDSMTGLGSPGEQFIQSITTP